MVHKISLCQVQGNLRERGKKNTGKCYCLPRLQEFWSYFWKLEEQHINFTPPCAQGVPCNDYITEATYMSIATGLLENPEGEKDQERLPMYLPVFQPSPYSSIVFVCVSAHIALILLYCNLSFCV